jgi:hypothetical protein
MRTYVIEEESIEHCELNQIDIKAAKHYFVIMNENEFDLVGGKFNIKARIDTDSMDKKNNLGIETYNKYYAVILNLLRIIEGKVIVHPIVLYVGKNFLLVSSTEETDLVTNLESELLSKPEVMFKETSSPSNKIL